MPEVQIEAKDIQNDDVWLGEDGTELHITSHVAGPTRNVIPWLSGRSAIPIPMKMILIRGALKRKDEQDFTWEWTLQPDQPIVVRRG